MTEIYFVNDGTPASLPPNDPVQAMSPFVSEAAPGDQDWNGGKWTHFSAFVVDGAAFDDRKPLTSERDVMEAESAGAIEVTLGPPFPEAPPAFFLCPLNGPAKGQPK